MKKYLVTGLFLLSTVAGFTQHNITIRHSLSVQIVPESAKIMVTDSIFNLQAEETVFSLNGSFSVTSLSDHAKIEKMASGVIAKDTGMDRDGGDGKPGSVKLNQWKVKLKKGSEVFVVRYEGNISFNFSQSEEDYARGFSESPGIISDTGIYLAGSTHWIPSFNDKPVTYSLTTCLPQGWKSVSQGERVAEKVIADKHYDTWNCNTPQEEIFLIGARFIEYSHKMNSGIDAMAFLRTPDETLAAKYLDLTEQYMDMYQKLLGPYPYTKFALVENFWETGYGMPSFTLLGEKIIRFPFILYSSYPHELLHNWWGNSVYVDFEKGNWCEGITAYGADHLISEQRGQGEDYRRSTLQKFTNVVDETNDFPVNKFISRHDAASETIGYGKSMMMWHMLRRQLGDETFKKGFALFYENFKFKTASFDDIRTSFETVSGVDLKQFFNQWLTRTGAPEIAINEARVSKVSDKYQVSLRLQQKQTTDAFDVDIPVLIATEKGTETFLVNMKEKTGDFQFILPAEPLKLAVDPQYDVFRILDPMEVPPTWSKVLASRENLVILPSKAGESKMQLYRDFIDQWKALDNDNFEVISDNEITNLPSNKTNWILGFENRFADRINSAIAGAHSSLQGDSVVFQNKHLAKENHSFVLTVYNEQNLEYNLAFIALDNPKAIEGLIRKLPHYGKYSYLGFEGDEPVNVAKGEWPVLNSPLIRIFDDNAQNLNLIQKREPLAAMAPVFSEQRMMDHLKYLASDEMKGRGLGTPELDEAADYIAGKFKEVGLEPMGGSWFQQFSHTFPDKGEIQMKNVVAMIKGTDEKLKDSPVVISAHYDHLGTGWPDVHKGDEGKIHPGADDNASGVSILLEVARSMAKTVQPKRTIIFVAFTGEEAGLIGSRYFVSQAKNHFPGTIMANVNLDTDGSLFDKKLLVLNGNSAKEWKFVFMGTDYTTGVKSEVIQQELDASDQVAFIEKGIPAVQLFTGATENYHKPSDTWDKIDGKGLVIVATVTKEVAEYLAGRDAPFEFTGQMAGSDTPVVVKPKSDRKASTGSVPDFAYTGEGVKIASVSKDSPGEKAGLQAGDIITAINGETVKGLKEYSEKLKNFQPGDVVEFNLTREEQKKVVSVTLGER
ncbi:MAG: M20/M25/M40 family metallo-hydrolase [Lentimicrobium sp.]